MIPDSSHIPVLLNEVIKVLDPKPGEFFVDGTVGGGGHAAEIAKHIAPDGTLLMLDRDPDAIERARRKSCHGVKTTFVEGNYAELPEILKEKNLGRADGLLLDLGFSSFQIEDAKRGFSFMKDGPLDMRYGGNGETVAEAVNSLSREKLMEIFREFGEERRAREIASAIAAHRRKEKILTTGTLARVIEEAVGPRRGHIHSATKVFQALRIYVNRELESLETVLGRLSEIVVNGGRVAIISFHSLEDRVVKNRFRDLVKSGKAALIVKKPITPAYEEILKNPRSRSAKLRAIQII